jgi:hypothetical protein
MNTEVTVNMRSPWYGGILYEVSPFGTGFIEDTKTGRLYGFHKSMLPSSAATQRLEGASVRFQLDATNAVLAVDLIAI